MDPMLLLTYALLLLFFLAISYYGVPLFIEKWKGYQEGQVEKATSRFDNMFMFFEKKRIYVAFFALPLVLFIIAAIAFENIIFAFLGLAVGVLIPFMYIKKLEQKRKRMFEKQLVDGLTILANSLKAGLSMLQAMDVLVEEMSPPLRDEFSLVVREIRMGVSLEEAFQHLNQRMPSEEMDLITAAVLVAKETGGDLTKVFARLIDKIRERYKLKEMVETLTFQGKLQGYIMSLIPIAFVLFILNNNPDHFDIMLKDDAGRLMLGLAVVLQVVAFILIKIFSVVKV
ncbi:MAG: type II secretion system F family protein [Candidatus Omnitrophica bacterium]|nr:type II secretion system F family protein [Candidatus Omnitrophota bacterium]